MIIDTHIHAYPTSLDSHVTLKEIVGRAKERGLDGICITDHDSNEIKEKAHAYAKESGFLILVGVEILTYEGDMVVFGLENLPKEKLHAQDLLDLVIKNKGVAISAHPYRENNRGMGDHIRSLKGLHGIEAFNGNTKEYNNLYAYGLSNELKIPAFGASDAHHRHEVGKFATIFPNGIRDEKDLIEAIRLGNVSPAIYKNGSYEEINVFGNREDRKIKIAG